MEKIETDILAGLRNGEEKSLKYVYDNHYGYLCGVVYKMIGDRATAEDLVQDLIYDLWRKRDRLNVTTSFKAYLRRAIVNKTLNYIRDKKLSFESDESVMNLQGNYSDSLQELQAEDVKKVIDAAINSLPERCRLIFGLSRFENMSYKEIAISLDVSVKTVENQMSKALKVLRSKVYRTEN